jgi:hypothetical protein
VLVASTVPELLAPSAPVYLYRHCPFQQSLTTVCRTRQMVFDIDTPRRRVTTHCLQASERGPGSLVRALPDLEGPRRWVVELKIRYSLPATRVHLSH